MDNGGEQKIRHLAVKSSDRTFTFFQ